MHLRMGKDGIKPATVNKDVSFFKGMLQRAIGYRELGYVFLNPKTNDRYYSIHKTFDRAVRKLDLKVGDTKFHLC